MRSDFDHLPAVQKEGMEGLNDKKDSPIEGKIKGQLVSWAVLCVLIVVKVL